MNLFFTHAETLNTATADLQELVVLQTPSGHDDLILKRGDYLLPSAFQEIQWDFLPDHICTYRTFLLPISVHLQVEAIRLDSSQQRWLLFLF